MNNQDWLERMGMLCNRFSHLGMGDDLASLSPSEAWGLYRFLLRLDMERES
jgi:hypothetical protein